ncbi:MAG TPA: hypothetical protein VFE62_07075 [Gemmataceae bacterium]|nr:hypothetical protein [Gemmataceae bacterium]
MKSKRLHLAILLTALGALVAWAAHAQDLFLPPPVLQSEKSAGKAQEPKASAVKLPAPTKEKDKKKGPDPTLIIPPEVYDVPHPGGPVEAKPGLLLTEGTGTPAPKFPADAKGPTIPLPSLPVPEPKKEPAPLPSLPIPEPQPNPLPSVPVVEPKPIPPPEPTKVLVVQPVGKDPLPIEKSPPMPEPTKVLVDPLPPTIQKKTPEAPQPPTISFPPAQAEAPRPPAEKSKAFIRLNSAANEITPAPLETFPAPGPHKGTTPDHLAPGPVLGQGKILPAPPSPNAMVNLSLPAVTVEKRGPVTLQAGETQSYQIVIRNLGPGPAQQVRIEDDLPSGIKLIDIGPQPQWQGPRAVWTLSNVAPGAELIIRMTLKADRPTQLANSLSAHVSAMQQTNTVALRPANHQASSTLAVRLTAPDGVVVGKPAVFDIHVTNQSGLPLTGIVLFGYLPEGLNTESGHEIEGKVGGVLAPGATKVIKMPTNAVKPGRYTVRVKVATNRGEGSATSTLEIGADTLTIHQAPVTRMYLGRDSDLQFQVANGTGKPLRHVEIACRLPEGIDYVGATDSGGYQSNHRTVYWLVDTLPAGHTHTVSVRVHGDKPGQYPCPVFARADGVPETHTNGSIAIEGKANLSLNLVGRDNPLEVNKDTAYEVLVVNGGGAPAHKVRLQVQFPAGIIPGEVQGNTRYTVNGQTVIFEPIPQLAPNGQVIVRISARAQTIGDQRVQVSVVSDEMPTPIQREVSTKVY